LPYLKIDGKRAYYAGDINREGIPVLFCHGSGGGHHHWIYQLKKLSGKVNPLALDLPGHGRSEGDPGYEIAFYRNWLHKFTAVLNPGPFVIAGHSMGGAIALDYTLNYPSEILGLILIGSGGRLRVLPAFLETLQEGSIPSDLVDFLYCPDSPEELLEKARSEIDSTPASLYHADLSACDRFDAMEKLHHIMQPVMMICGSEDRLTPVKYSLYLEEKLPAGRVEVIEGAGHMVMLEKPAEVNRAITGFVEDLPVQ
jgi:pimeloyl-ACP methyl ester carboxylesterase